MVAISADRIESFVKEQCAKAPAEDPVVSVWLRHTRVGGGSSRKIDSWTPSDENDPASIARAIMVKAFEDAEAFTSAQQYAVAAYRQSDLNEPAGTRTFRVQPPSGDDGASVQPSEPATPEGVLAQLMRHSEGREKLYVQTQEKTYNALLKTIEAQQGIVDALATNAAKVYDERERLMLERAAVQFAEVQRMAEENTGFDIKKAIAESFTAVIPTAVPMLLSSFGKMMEQRNAPPANASTLADIIKTLPDDERSKLLHALGLNLLPSQAIVQPTPQPQPQPQPTPTPPTVDVTPQPPIPPVATPAPVPPTIVATAPAQHATTIDTATVVATAAITPRVAAAATKPARPSKTATPPARPPPEPDEAEIVEDEPEAEDEDDGASGNVKEPEPTDDDDDRGNRTDDDPPSRPSRRRVETPAKKRPVRRGMS